MRDIYLYPEKTGSGGTGPEDDPQYAARSIRTNGLSVIAFGVTLAFTFLFLFIAVGLLKASPLFLDNELHSFSTAIKPLNWLSYILYGFFTGAAIAGIYNMLVVKTFNKWGIENSVD